MGSAAATPVRATTPDAVVLPLQYAVAAKGTWLPGRGGPLCASDCQNALRESNISALYMKRKPTTAITSTTTFRRIDCEMVAHIVGKSSKARTPLNLPEVLVSFRELPFASLVFDDQARRPGDDADSGYRQIAEMSSYGPQPSSLFGPDCKDQLEIIAAAQRDVDWIATLLAEPFSCLLAQSATNGASSVMPTDEASAIWRTPSANPSLRSMQLVAAGSARAGVPARTRGSGRRYRPAARWPTWSS